MSFGANLTHGELSEEARSVLDYLVQQEGKTTLLGYNVYPHTPDVFQQTGKRAAIVGRDLQWLGDRSAVIRETLDSGCLLSIHWHWFFDEDSAWRGRRAAPVNIGRMLEEGTAENLQLQEELEWAANQLEAFARAKIPVLWRPLHEIDGGWFWWTDREQPENTAELWRVMYRYFTYERGLNNLIWVYSAGIGNKTLEYRKRFYPGDDYVDISGIDVYNVEHESADPKYWEYYDAMQQVSPGKPLAMGEGDALPDPELMKDGTLPPWLWVLPWWGVPSEGRSATWARYTAGHDFVTTLEDLPKFFGDSSLDPIVGILSPSDNGAARYGFGEIVRFVVEAVDRDGSIDRVALLVDGIQVAEQKGGGTLVFDWAAETSGFRVVTAKAWDNEGIAAESNSVRVLVGGGLAKVASVSASSGQEEAKNVADGDFHSLWTADPSDPQWVSLDFGKEIDLGELWIQWGFRSNGSDFEIAVASGDSEREDRSWDVVLRRFDRSYQSWKAMDRFDFKGIKARYLKLVVNRRAGEWANEGTSVADILVFEDSTEEE